jgi:hypothetical protein
MTTATMEASQYVHLPDAILFARILAASGMVSALPAMDEHVVYAAEAEPGPEHIPRHASSEPDAPGPGSQYEQGGWFTDDRSGYDPDQTDPAVPIAHDNPPLTSPAGSNSPYFGDKRQRHFHDQAPGEPLELDLETTKNDSLGEHPNVGLDLKGAVIRSHRKSAMQAEQKTARPERKGDRLRRVARSVGYFMGIATTTTSIMMILDGISTRIAN